MTEKDKFELITYRVKKSKYTLKEVEDTFNNAKDFVNFIRNLLDI